jgi:SAM-dependent methyltransferase
VLYQHPLAYLLGLEGAALLLGGDREFVHARLDEIRTLLDDADELGGGIEAHPITTRESYASWASFYDEPGNEMIDLEQPVVRAILAAMPVGVALDAACGTGRHAAYLAELGHTVIGVDESPEMLAIARENLPAAELLEGDLCALPLADESVATWPVADDLRPGLAHARRRDVRLHAVTAAGDERVPAGRAPARAAGAALRGALPPPSDHLARRDTRSV